MSVKPKNIEAINKYITGETDSFIDIYLIGDTSSILNSLKYYVKLYPEHLNEINYIMSNLSSLTNIKLNKEEIKKVFENALKYRYVKYISVINDILFVDEIEAIKIIKSKNYSVTDLSSSIKKFKTNYPLQTEEIEKLNNILISAKSQLNKKDKRNCYLNKNALFDMNNSNKQKEIDKKLKDLYLSNLSIEEYCSNNGLWINSIKLLCEKNREYYKEIIDEILKRDSSEFKNYIKDVGIKILESDEFDRLDYYLNTKLKYEDFRDILYEVLPKDKVILILRKFSKMNKISYSTPINKEKELEIINTIGGRVITKEEKERIFNYLEDNSIPIDLYRIALKRYANGTLDLGRQKKKC